MANKTEEFKCTGNGVFCDGNKICDYLKIIGLVKTLAEKTWKVRLEFKDMAGEKCIIDVDSNKVRKTEDLINDLTLKGLCPVIESSKFKKYVYQSVENREAIKRYIEVKQTGWIDEDFVCPSFCFSKNINYIYEDKNNSGYEQRGSFEEWQTKVSELCKGNSALIFAISEAFAAPLLKFFPSINSTIFNFVGKSSTGKTTVARLASSVWGNYKNYVKQWRMTSNAQEIVASLHNYTLLVLDELSQAKDEEIKSIAYTIGNENGKARMTSSVGLREPIQWRTFGLSTAEIGVSEIIERLGKRVPEGVLARFVDIYYPMDEEKGIFEDLHGFKTSKEFAEAIVERVSKYYGTAAEKYMKSLLEMSEERIREIFAETLSALRKDCNISNEDTSNGLLSRVLNAFALVNTVGRIVSNDELGIVNLETVEIDNAIQKILNICLPDLRNLKDKKEEIKQEVIEWFKRNESYFIPTHQNGERRLVLDYKDIKIKVFGYKIEDKNLYYWLPKNFKDFCKETEIRVKEAKQLLIRSGVIEEHTEMEGKNLRKRVDAPIWINGSRVRCIKVSLND